MSGTQKPFTVKDYHLTSYDFDDNGQKVQVNQALALLIDYLGYVGTGLCTNVDADLEKMRKLTNFIRYSPLFKDIDYEDKKTQTQTFTHNWMTFISTENSRKQKTHADFLKRHKDAKQSLLGAKIPEATEQGGK